MNPLLTVGIAGWLAAAVTGWLWLQARDNVIFERESCNTRAVTAIAAAERITREAAETAFKAREAQLAARVALETKARQIAEAAALEAESRPVRVRTVVKEVASANKCLSEPIPAELVDALRVQ